MQESGTCKKFNSDHHTAVRRSGFEIHSFISCGLLASSVSFTFYLLLLLLISVCGSAWVYVHFMSSVARRGQKMMLGHLEIEL